MEDVFEVIQNNLEESSSMIKLDRKAFKALKALDAAKHLRLTMQPQTFYNNEETFSSLPCDQTDFNIPKFQSLSLQKSQGHKSSKKDCPLHRGHSTNIKENYRGPAKDTQYYFYRRQSNPRNIQATSRDESKSFANEEDKDPLPIQSSSFSKKSPDYEIKYPPNRVNTNKMKNKTDYRETEKSSYHSALNLNAQDTLNTSIMKKSISPSEIIMNYMQQIEKIYDHFLEQHFQKVEKVFAAIQEREAYADILNLQYENLLLQQQNFDKSAHSLRCEISMIDDMNAENIIKKADTTMMYLENECSLFKNTLPAYAYKIQILKALENYQVVIIASDCSYFFNKVTPVIASFDLSDYSVISCEYSNMSCSLVKSDIEMMMTHKIESSDITCMNEDEMLSYLDSDEKSSKNCFILNVPLEHSITSDLILECVLDVLHQHKESKLILLLSMFDDISKYQNYFSDLGVFLLEVPKLLLPVKTVWKEEPLSMKDYKEEVVCTALSIHILNEAGDVIAFLPCLAEAKTALSMFTQEIIELKLDNVECVLLDENNLNIIHLKKLLKSKKRKIFFSTHYAEAISIPSVRYVVDCGLRYSCIIDNGEKIEILTEFSSRSRSRLRKSLVGVYSTGICYRIYNKENFCYDMSTFECARYFNS